MQFFTDRYGDQYPVSGIRRIARIQEKREPEPPYSTRYQTITMDDGEQVYVAEWTVEEITKAPVAVLPAQPGTFLLGGVEAEDESADAIWQTPVIAWGVGIDNDVRPWTADGPDDGLSRPSPVLFATGLVVAQGDRSYRTLEDWFNEERNLKRTANQSAENDNKEA